MSQLTSYQALELTAHFALIADRMRASHPDFHRRACVCEQASRIAFLRAQVLAKNEETRPVFGNIFRRAAFAVA